MQNKFSEKKRVMVDLETLGNRPGCVIVAIGAVVFSRGGLEDVTFYARIDPASCVDVGLEMDVSTVMWWLGQSEAARREIKLPGEALSAVLLSFANWLGMLGEDVEIWGNGAAFDNAILAAAYHAVQIPLPWKFWNDRCYRTVKGENPHVPMARTGTHHNALDDARSQAEHLIAIWQSLQAAPLHGTK